MKYLRFYVMFGVTLILVLLILFLPYKNLAVYKNKITIFYNFKLDEGYKWDYVLSNDNLKLSGSKIDRWTFVPNKNGETTLTFYCRKDESDEFLYKIEYKFKIKGNKITWTYGSALGLTNYPNPY